MDLTGAIREFFGVVRDIFTWKTGGRTMDENRLRARMDAAQEEHDAAIESGDAVRISRARKLQLALLREAQAKRG